MAKIKKIHSYHIYAALIGLLLAILTVRYLILQDASLITEHRDVSLPPLLTNIFNHYFFTWNELGSHAFFEGIARVWLSFFLFFSPNVAVLSRLYFLFYYFMLFFVPYISFFYLLKTFLKYDEKISFLTALVVGFFYSFNPYVIQAYSPPYTYTFSYALLPALVTLLLLNLEKDTFSLKILLAITITLTITPIVRYIIIVLILIAIITILHSIQAFKDKTFSFRLFAKKTISVTILLCLLNLYWLVPTFFSSGSGVIHPSYVVTYETTRLFSTSYTMTDIFTLSASWNPTLALNSPLFLTGAVWTLLLFFIPLISLASLLSWKSFDKKETLIALSAALVYIIGLSLWTGVKNPISILSNLYSFFLLSVHPSIGWMFRVPGYFGTLVVFAGSLLLGILTTNVINRIKTSEKSTRKYLYVSLIIAIVLTSAIVGWQRFTGNLDGVLENGYYTEDAIGKVENGTKFIPLVTNYDGNFTPQRIGASYFALPNDLDSYLKEANDDRLIAYVMQMLNARNLITNLNLSDNYLDKSSTTIYDLSIFQLNQAETNQVSPIRELIFFDGNWHYLSPLSMVTNPEHGLTTENIELSQMILNPESSYLTLRNEETNVLYLTPFYSTIHHDPSKVWSKAGTNDPLHGPWHSYLESRNIENWDSDYSKGLVFTWAPSKLENASPTYDDLVNQWNFDSTNDTYQWQNYTRETQDDALNIVSPDDGALKTELWNSTEGWKTINSPTISAEYGNWYRWDLRVKGENAQDVHVKIGEYDQEQKIINAYRVAGVASGNFDWQTITIDYTPENPDTKYIQLQVWHGHETTQPLPNTIWIDNVQIYDLQRFVEPLSIETPFTTSKANEYVLLTRLFQNQEGGEIQIQLDGKNYSVSTKDQLNKFTWQQIDTLNLQKGQHKITLINIKGFNAVNLFALVPMQQYQAAQNQLAETLQNKRLIYIFDAGNDLYHNSEVTSSKYDEDASNGIVLELSPTSEVWRELEILRPGNYTFAIRSKGNLSITIDDTTYLRHSTRLYWAYIGPITLETGTHKMKIAYPTTYYGGWTFENGEPLGWTSSHSSMQTLTIDENAYEGSYSLKAELNASTGGWKTISSPLIPVTPELKYSWAFNAAGENAYSVHVKIAEYDLNKTLLTSKYVKSIGNGNFTWTQIAFEYTPSEKAAYIALQVWHGHETTQPLPNTMWIDNVKVYKDSADRSDLDVVWLYSTLGSNETLETIFAQKKTSASVVNYQKINPTKYQVTVDSSTPFMLSFAEAYDPLWVAYVDGERVASVPLFSLINGFQINQTGILEITVEYAPQEWFYYGSLISATTIIAALIYLAYGWTKKRKRLIKVKNLHKTCLPKT